MNRKWKTRSNLLLIALYPYKKSNYFQILLLYWMYPPIQLELGKIIYSSNPKSKFKKQTFLKNGNDRE